MTTKEDKAGGFVRGAGGNDGKPRQQHNSIVPITLKQFQTGEPAQNEDKLYIDGREVTQVRVVGQIQEFTPNATGTNFTFQLDDGTATGEIKLWIHESQTGVPDFHDTQKAQWRQGIYIEVFGTIKLQQNRRSIFAQRVQAVTNYNIITHHFLQCIHTHLFVSKGSANHVHQIMAKFDPYAAEAVNKPDPGINNPYNNAATASTSGDIGTAIMELCKNAPPKGFHIDQIVAKLPQFSAADIQGTIEMLLPTGGVYTTLDNHYKG